MSSRWIRNGLIYLIITVIVAALFYNVYSASTSLSPVPITTVAQDIRDGRVSKILVSGEELRITRTSGAEVISRKEPGADLTQVLTNLGVTQEMLNGITIEIQSPSEWGSWLAIFSSFLPLLLIGGLFCF